MVSMFASAASGLVYNQTVMDVVANNLANMNTYAFKTVRAQSVGKATADAAAEPGGGRMGVSETSTEMVFTQGNSQYTGEPLHFSVQDDSFFRVIDKDGRRGVTRVGALSLDAAGNVTLPGGSLLDPPVVVPDGMLHPEIAHDGIISAIDAAGDRQPLGQITLVRFMNPGALELAGNGLYRETPNSGESTEGPPGSAQFAGVISGALEGSNVEIAEEFTNMLMAQRAYQASSKTFSIGDEMLRIATNLTQ